MGRFWRPGGCFAGKPGKIYAHLLADRDTNFFPTAAYWNPTKDVFVNQETKASSDTRLDPNKKDNGKFTFAVPTSGMVSITVRLIYRYAFIDLARQKGWTREDVLVNLVQCDIDPLHLIKSECE